MCSEQNGLEVSRNYANWFRRFEDVSSFGLPCVYRLKGNLQRSKLCQSVMTSVCNCLKVGRESRRSRDRLSGSRMALWASRTNCLAAGRPTASRSRTAATNTREVSYAIQCIRRRVFNCLNLLSSCHAHSG